MTAAGALGGIVGSLTFAGGLHRPLLVAGSTAAAAVTFFAAGRYVVERAAEDERRQRAFELQGAEV